MKQEETRPLSFPRLKEPDPTLAAILPEQEARPGLSYIPSRFAFAFSHGGTDCVFHTLTKELIAGRLPEAAEAGGEYDALIRRRFLVPEGKDESAYYTSVSTLLRMIQQRESERSYVILPTLCCNARCVYCYEEGRPQSSMSAETVERLLKLIRDTHTGRKVRLQWFGGEPLLCQEIIDRVCAGLQALGLDYRCTMISNGSLITPAVIEKMKGDWRMEHVQVSMDGLEPDYIARKRYCAYDGYYHKVMDSVSRMSEAGIHVAIRCNVDEENWPGAERFIRELEEGVEHKERVSLYFYPLFQTSDTESEIDLWKKIIAIRSQIEAAGFTARNYSAGLSFRAHYCMADAGGIVIEPDGSLYPCEHCGRESRYGSLYRDKQDEALRFEFCRTDRTREKCRECPFLPICTNFASCPNNKENCREIRELQLLDDLGRFLERREQKQAEESPAEPVEC